MHYECDHFFPRNITILSSFEFHTNFAGVPSHQMGIKMGISTCGLFLHKQWLAFSLSFICNNICAFFFPFSHMLRRHISGVLVRSKRSYQIAIFVKYGVGNSRNEEITKCKKQTHTFTQSGKQLLWFAHFFTEPPQKEKGSIEHTGDATTSIQITGIQH